MCSPPKKITSGVDDTLLDFEEKPKNERNLKPWLIGGGLALLIVGIGAIVAAYYLNPNFHSMMDNAFSYIKSGQMSVGQGLLYIALPIVGASFLIGLTIHLYQKHTYRMETEIRLEKTNAFKEIWKSIGPTRKQVVIAAVVFVALAALAVGGYFLFQQVTAAHQWMYGTVVPAFGTNIQAWLGLAAIGGGTAVAVLLTGLAIYLAKKRTEDKIPIFNYDEDYIAT